MNHNEAIDVYLKAVEYEVLEKRLAPSGPYVLNRETVSSVIGSWKNGWYWLVKMFESENSKSLYSMPETFWKKNKIPPPPPRSDLVNGTTIKWGDVYPPFIIVVILSLVSLVALSALIEF